MVARKIRRAKLWARGHSEWPWTLGAALAYLAATVLYLGPALIADCTTRVYGGPGDNTAGLIWLGWNYDVLGGSPFDRTPFVDAPDGSPLWQSFYVSTAFSLIAMRAGTLVTNEVCAWNALTMSGFVLSGLAMYGLVRWLTRNRYIAFVAGWAFTFTPFHFVKATGHVNYVHTWIFPLVLWAALHLIKGHRPRRSAIVLGALIAAGGYIDGYYLLILPVFAASALVPHLLSSPRGADFPGRLRAVATAAATAVLLLIPAVMTLAGARTEAAQAQGRGTDRASAISAADIYSARLPEYILPDPGHPLMPDGYAAWRGAQLHGSNLSEQSLYLGVTVILAAGAFLLAMVCRRPAARAAERMTNVPALTVGLTSAAVVCLAWSAPPIVSIAFLQLPTPSRLVLEFIVNWRVYARFFIGVDTAVVVLAAMGLHALTRARHWPSGVSLAALPVIMLDLSTGFSRPSWSYVDDVPAVYQFLAQDPPQGSLATYPVAEHPQGAALDNLTYQRLHQMPLVGGPAEDQEDLVRGRSISGLLDAQTLPALRSLGVSRVVILPSAAAAPLPPGLRPLYQDESGAVYAVEQGPKASMLLTLEKGFLPPEDDALRSRNWMGTGGVISARPLPGHAASEQSRIGFSATSFGPPRRLVLRQHGQILHEVVVGAAPVQVDIVVDSLVPVQVQTTPGAVQVSSLLPGSPDDRVLGVALSDLRASPST